VIWTSRRCASDHCGFLAWCWRAGDRICEVVDLTEAVVAPHQTPEGRTWLGGPVVALGVLSAEMIVANEFFGLARPLTPEQRGRHHQQWETLRLENADLRVCVDGNIMSAPISIFDADLLRHTTPEWRKAARIIGGVFGDFYDQNVLQIGDDFLWARLRGLVASGQLVHRGDLLDMRTTEIRRP
jgi:hypothetical protein